MAALYTPAELQAALAAIEQAETAANLPWFEKNAIDAQPQLKHTIADLILTAAAKARAKTQQHT